MIRIARYTAALAGAGLTLCLGASGAAAESMSLDVVLSPKDEIRLHFEHDSRRHFQLTQREGTADGAGPFTGAKVVEYGMHDVVVGDRGIASGYFEVTTTEGDIAYLKWRLRAHFIAGAEDKVKVVNTGYWELIGGIGQFAGMRGVGTLLLQFVSKTERRFLFEGDISPAP